MSARDLLASKLPNWWVDANSWLEDHCAEPYGCYYYYLAGAYGLLAIVALIQLIRIQIRVPDYGWTTQKVFHLLNFLFCLLRAVTFGLHFLQDDLAKYTHREIVFLLILELPGLLFFTTYTLLVLFWAEIYHQASNVDTGKLRPMFVRINVAVYLIAGILWVLTLFKFINEPTQWARIAGAAFLAAVSLSAVIGFLVYGCRLFGMLKQFPIESRGRKKKLQEVGFITFVCSVCFTARAVITAMYIVDKKDFDLDMLDKLHNPLANIIFYTFCEILVVASVLGILHRLPPKRSKSVAGAQYQEVPKETVQV